MEYYFFSLFIVLFTSFVSIFMLQKLTRKPKHNLPPGPWKLPFIGNLHQLLPGSHAPHQKLRDLAKKYGPLMRLQLGELSFIVVSSPETGKQFMKTHDLVFASRPVLPSEFSCYGDADMVFCPYGEYSKQMRKICTLQLLSAKRVESFRTTREEEILELCKWMAIQAENGSVINMTEKVSMMNYHIMARAALGKKTYEQAMFIAAFKEAAEFFTAFQIANIYPSIKFFRTISSLKAKVRKLHQETNRVIESIIEDRVRDNAAKLDDDLGGKHEDLLDVLLKFLNDGSLELPLTTNHVKAVILDIFGAGIETSTTVIDWAIAEMLKNPRVMKKAQDELRHVFDSKQGPLDESYFDELKYFKLVVRETLRLHPPSAIFPRESSESCEINGYEIPAKTRVLVNAWAIGRDPGHWEDGDSFIPERFLEKQIDYRDGNSFEYIPFGAGRRKCPGISFGLATVELTLAMFLYHFDWVLPNGMKPEDLEMMESSGLVARKKDYLHVVPVLKRPLPV